MGDRRKIIRVRRDFALLRLAGERKFSRRRRGWDAPRRGRNCLGILGCWYASFAFPADTSVPRILNKYTTFGEFLADAIGGGEIAPLPRGLTVCEQFFDLGVTRGAAVAAVAEYLEFLRIVTFDHGEDLIEC